MDSQLALLADILFCPLLLGACSHTTKLITLPLSLPFKIQTVNTSNTLSLCFCFIAIQRLHSLACLTVYRSVSFNSSSNSTKMVDIQVLCLRYNSQDRTGGKDQCLNQRFLNSFSQKGEF